MSGSVRRLRPDEVKDYKAVRLAALADSPSAFTETLAQASMLADEVWAERVESHNAGATAIIVADDGARLVGLAAGIPFEGRARVVSVWVDPAFRGRGLAAALIEEVCAWAAGAGYAEIQIETAIGNSGPRRIYERLGFEPTDIPPPAGCDPVLVRHLP